MYLKFLLFSVLFGIYPIRAQNSMIIMNDSSDTSKAANNPISNKLRELYLSDYIFVVSGVALSVDLINYFNAKDNYNNHIKEYQNMREDEYEKYKKIHENINHDIHKLNKIPVRIKIERTVLVGSFLTSLLFRAMKSFSGDGKKKIKHITKFTIDPSIQINSITDRGYGIRFVCHF